MNDNRQDAGEDHSPQPGAPKRPLPSPWLMSYSITMILGGCYSLWIAVSGRHQFVILSYALAVAALLVGVLMWFRQRGGIVGYVAIALGLLGFAGFRFITEGYTQARLGMALGSIMMLVGLSSITDEYRTGDRS